GGFCVIGGFVYRGNAFPELRGFYLYGDYFTTRIWAAARDAAGAWQRFILFEPPTVLSGVSSFGEDAAGELYIASHGSPGHIERLVRAGPDTPTPVSPMGTIAAPSPAYTWNAVQGVDQYMLVVQNTAEVRVNAAYSPAAAGCPAGTGTCTATPSVALAGNTPYNWFVRAANVEGTSPWSVAAPLVVSGGGGGNAPDAPVPIAPMGTVGTTTPVYTWNPVAGATSYALLVQNTSGVAVNRSVAPESIGCASGIGTCSAMPPEALANGVLYNWFVNATNAIGTGAWSAPTSIAASAGPGGPPAAPTLVSPSGVVTTATPTYTWNAVSGAASYFLLVQNTAAVAVAHPYTAVAAGCASGTGLCSATPGEPLTGNTSYAWFVNAANGDGAGAWSAGNMIFASAAGGAPAAPSPVSPSGLLSTTMPTYVWNAVPGAASYFLLVQNTAGVAVAVDITAAAAGCSSGAGLCSVMPSTALASAMPYAWFVRATDNAGTSDWSAGSAIRTP